MSTPTARFWAYVHCPTRLTLRLGETRHHHTWEPTEEGWSSQAHTWSFDGEAVTLEYIATALDRLLGDPEQVRERRLRLRCPLARLATGPTDPEIPAVRYPDWERLEATQYDAQAAAAGY